MDSRLKLLVCAALSLIVHAAVARGLEALPPQQEYVPPKRITIAVVAPPDKPPPAPPPVEPPPPPPPAATPPPPPPPPKVPVVQHAKVATAPTPTPSPEPPAPAHAAPAAPTPTPAPTEFNVSMDSSSTVGVPVGTGGGGTGGNGRGGAGTGNGQPAAGPAAPSAGTAHDAPIGAYEATKLPLPDEHCHYSLGKYTDAAIAAGTEGTVVVDLTVGADGHPRDIAVVNPLPNGLTEAAITALKACKFSPGEKAGERVAVRIRGFKIVFVLPEHD